MALLSCATIAPILITMVHANLASLVRCKGGIKLIVPSIFIGNSVLKQLVRSGIRTHARKTGLRPERSALDRSAILTSASARHCIKSLDKIAIKVKVRFTCHLDLTWFRGLQHIPIFVCLQWLHWFLMQDSETEKPDSTGFRTQDLSRVRRA